MLAAKSPCNPTHEDANLHAHQLPCDFEDSEILSKLLVGGFNPSEKYESNWVIFPKIGVKTKYTLPKTNMSPENWWLEDLFPIEIVPF